MRLFTALALSFCLAQSAGAQTKPAKKTSQKAKAAPAASPAAAPAADANAKPQISEVGKRDPFVPLVRRVGRLCLRVKLAWSWPRCTWMGR
jgi:pyruvate/2-oxoglutarate dehydrogenase complex dihydrolipoamide acyltransferase (E2) component